jgi:hypothetical protein
LEVHVTHFQVMCTVLVKLVCIYLELQALHSQVHVPAVLRSKRKLLQHGGCFSFDTLHSRTWMIRSDPNVVFIKPILNRKVKKTGFPKNPITKRFLKLFANPH